MASRLRKKITSPTTFEICSRALSGEKIIFLRRQAHVVSTSLIALLKFVTRSWRHTALSYFSDLESFRYTIFCFIARHAALTSLQNYLVFQATFMALPVLPCSSTFAVFIIYPVFITVHSPSRNWLFFAIQVEHITHSSSSSYWALVYFM